jgi:lysophospholipase L1-like esterase
LTRLGLLLGLLAAASLGPAAAAQDHRSEWVEAYQSSPADFDFVIPKDMKLPDETRERLRDRPPVVGTLRMRLTLAASGHGLRIRISNEDGVQPLLVDGASVGIAAEGFDARAGTLRPLAFGGKRRISLAPGAPALSDPVDLDVAALDEVVVSLHLPQGLKLKAFGNQLMAFAAGDQSLSPHLGGGDTIIGRPPVSGALVLSPHPPRVIVALGDSITDGNRPRAGQLHGWPDQLLRRLVAAGGSDRVTVVNAGIGGNRVLSTSWGDAALARFDRDVMRVRGVSHVILLEGINDIGRGGSSSLFGQNPPLDVADLIAGYEQIIARAHVAGIKVVIATLTPFGGSTSHSPEREAQRQAVNQWIRTAGVADAIIDFDAAVRDPHNPLQLRADYDSGDHIHPSDAGYRAMGDAIDLSLFDPD